MNTPDSPHYVAPGKPRLPDQVRWVIRLMYYSSKTETAYIGWIRRFIFFHGKRHPALERQVAASTQNQTFNALIFLHHRVLHIDVGEIDGAVRAKKPKRLPVVLNREVVDSILTRLHGEVWLVCSLLYGAGLRLFETPQLRVKDTGCVWQ